MVLLRYFCIIWSDTEGMIKIPQELAPTGLSVITEPCDKHGRVLSFRQISTRRIPINGWQLLRDNHHHHLYENTVMVMEMVRVRVRDRVMDRERFGCTKRRMGAH